MKSLVKDSIYPYMSLKADIFDYGYAANIFEHLKKNVEQEVSFNRYRIECKDRIVYTTSFYKENFKAYLKSKKHNKQIKKILNAYFSEDEFCKIDNSKVVKLVYDESDNDIYVIVKHGFKSIIKDKFFIKKY